MNPVDVDKQDAALAIRAQKGDRDSFGHLVGRFQTRIYSFCYQFFRNRDVAAEMTQETFLRSYRYIKKYDPNKKFSTWIYSIAKNICIDEKRKMDRSRTVPIEDVSPSSFQISHQGQHMKDPSQISLHLEDRMLLEAAIAQLPEKYKAAIILCYFQELPYQEIADILGMSLNLVKVRIFRAKKQLLEILKEQQDGDHHD
jgi:RNA polymerase sigma-70 factor (ECF subfamily)